MTAYAPIDALTWIRAVKLELGVSYYCVEYQNTAQGIDWTTCTSVTPAAPRNIVRVASFTGWPSPDFTDQPEFPNANPDQMLGKWVENTSQVEMDTGSTLFSTASCVFIRGSPGDPIEKIWVIENPYDSTTGSFLECARWVGGNYFSITFIWYNQATPVLGLDAQTSTDPQPATRTA